MQENLTTLNLQALLNGFKDGFGEPYSSAEDILQVLKEVVLLIELK